MGYIEKIKRSLELPIGTRFYFCGRLYEVFESEEENSCCSKCAFFGSEKGLCYVMNCNEKLEFYGICDRNDKKYIYFKEVEKATD